MKKKRDTSHARHKKTFLSAAKKSRKKRNVGEGYKWN